jgi:hypothetical protein
MAAKVTGIRWTASGPERWTVLAPIGAIDPERQIADNLEAADRGRPRWK